MATTYEPKYHVGDTVIIQEFSECPFGWDDWGMDDYVGEEAVIQDIQWSDLDRAYVYYIDIDDREYMWCENCFIPVLDIDESDMSIESLFEG